MFTDSTFYTGKRFIPNLNETCDGLSFDEWIARNEDQCLRIVLHDCLYEELVSNMEWDESTESYVLIYEADEKWDWLINGRTYTKDDIESNGNCYCNCNSSCESFKWDGFVNSVKRRIPSRTVNGQTANGVISKTSFISDYVYWMWAINSRTVTTSTGEKILNVRGGEAVHDNAKSVAAYNSFVSTVTNCGCSGKVGLYRFLSDFNVSFPNWEGKFLDYEPIW